MENLDIKKINVPLTVLLVAAFSFFTWLVTWATNNGEKNQQLITVQADVNLMKQKMDNMSIDINNLKSSTDINIYKLNQMQNQMNSVNDTQNKVLQEVIEIRRK